MKRILSTALAVFTLGAATCFVACQPQELQMDKEYRCTGISFKKASDLTLNDLSSFIPMGRQVNSISDFEKLLIDNMDTYAIDRRTATGRERIFLSDFTHSLRVSEGYDDVENGYTFYLTHKGETQVLGAVRTEDTFTLMNDGEYVYYFENGAFHYDLELNEKFAIVYNYKT